MSFRARDIASLGSDAPFSFTVVRTMNLLAQDNPLLEEVVAGRPVIFLISPKIAQLYGDALRAYLQNRLPKAPTELVVATGEPNKTLASVERVVVHAERMHFSRRGIFVGIGGGILLDIVGFAASMFRRGTAHVKIGTTLVAQIDAAIGVKCGVNLGTSKNIVGAFHAPERVILDATFLSTLDEREVRCGLAEMIKLALVRDRKLFEEIERNYDVLLRGRRANHAAESLVNSAVVGMLEELRPNVFETSLQRAVDFGHTISPGLETASAFSLRHGEAVAIDIAVACVLSHRLGLMSYRSLARILDLLDSVGLPRWHELLESEEFVESVVSATVAHRGMKFNLPLLTGIGEVTFIEGLQDLPEGAFYGAVNALRDWSALGGEAER